jgi:AraC family transcriptional regulator, activator of mtrCDE
MSKHRDLDRLLVSMDVAVQSFAVCEVRKGRRLVGAAVDAIMIHYVLAGTMHMTVAGHDPIVCGPGCIALIPPGLKPVMTADGGAGTEVIGIEHAAMARDGMLLMDAADGSAGELRFVAGIVLASSSGSFGLLDTLDRPISENLGDLEVVRHAYATMLSEIAAPSLGTSALTTSLMKACLVLVLRRFIARHGLGASFSGAPTDERLASAVQAILDNPAAPHTVRTLTAHAGMSRATLARRFSDAFEMSPMEFVAKTRLRHAAHLLRTTPLPIKVIAASVGFTSRSHFSRAFRDAYGSDPSNFRKKLGVIPLDAPKKLRGSRRRFALEEE